MSYTRSTMRFKNVWEVSEYHTARYGAPGQLRQEKKKPTPEIMEKRNQYNRERLARWRLRMYFGPNDYFVTLTFRAKERPPDMTAAKKIFRDFCLKVGKQYKKRGYEIRWIRNIEVGTRNAWHIHLVVNRVPDTDIIIREAWPYGKVINQLLYERGEFRELAAYITKTPKTDSSLRETNYSTSRNMPLPEPEKKVYKHWKTWREFKKPEDRDAVDADYHVRIPKGFYLDKESYHEGINPFTGYKYRTYTLIRINRRD